MIVTAERYLKVVHPFWTKRHLKRWMIYAAIVLSWIGGGVWMLPIGFTTTLFLLYRTVFD